MVNLKECPSLWEKENKQGSFLLPPSLQLIHGTVVDTAIVFPHRLGLPYKRALRTLMADYLKRIIQDNGESEEGLRAWPRVPPHPAAVPRACLLPCSPQALSPPFCLHGSSERPRVRSLCQSFSLIPVKHLLLPSVHYVGGRGAV